MNPTPRARLTRSLERAAIWLAEQSGRAISGMRPSRPLVGMLPDVAPRPVLLGHTGGLRKHPAEYERRTVGFLDQALEGR